MVPHTLTLHTTTLWLALQHTLTQHNTTQHTYSTSALPPLHHTLHSTALYCTLLHTHTVRILHLCNLGGTTCQLQYFVVANSHLHLSLYLLHQASSSLSSISLSPQSGKPISHTHLSLSLLSPNSLSLSLSLHPYLYPARHFISISWLLCLHLQVGYLLLQSKATSQQAPSSQGDSASWLKLCFRGLLLSNNWTSQGGC